MLNRRKGDSKLRDTLMVKDDKKVCYYYADRVAASHGQKTLENSFQQMSGAKEHH